MMIAYILVKDIKSKELLSAFEQIHLPKKIMLSVTVALRFFPTYKLEIRMIRESLKMRNINLKITEPLKFLEYWLVPVLMRMNLIAEEMTATAMTKGVESPMRSTTWSRLSATCDTRVVDVGSGSIAISSTEAKAV